MTVRDAPADVVDAITLAMKVEGATLIRTKLVEVAPHRRNDRGWPVYIVAAVVDGPEFDGHQVATFAIGGGSDVGPIFALNGVAREYSAWGEAARPGSRADEMMKMLAAYPEAAEVVAAAAGGGG